MKGEKKKEEEKSRILKKGREGFFNIVVGLSGF